MGLCAAEEIAEREGGGDGDGAEVSEAERRDQELRRQAAEKPKSFTPFAVGDRVFRGSNVFVVGRVNSAMSDPSASGRFSLLDPRNKDFSFRDHTQTRGNPA